MAVASAELYVPLWANMMSSTKPEVHKILQHCQRRTESGLWKTCTKNLVKIGHAVPEIYTQTDKQTNRQTDHNTLHHYQGGVIICKLSHSICKCPVYCTLPSLQYQCLRPCLECQCLVPVPKPAACLELCYQRVLPTASHLAHTTHSSGYSTPTTTLAFCRQPG